MTLGVALLQTEPAEKERKHSCSIWLVILAADWGPSPAAKRVEAVVGD